MVEIGARERLQEQIDQRHWSERMLAARSGVSKSHINAFLKGKIKDMTLGRWLKIAKTLNLSIDWLAGLPSRTPGALLPDEQELLRLYHDELDEVAREWLLEMAHTMARKKLPESPPLGEQDLSQFAARPLNSDE